MRAQQFPLKLLGIFFSKEFCMYFFFGGIATLVDWGLVYISTSILGVWYVASVGVGYVGGLISAYTLHRKFTFQDRLSNIRKQFFIFWIITVIGLFLTWGIVIFSVEYIGLWYMHARILATGIMLFWNFVGHKYVTFRADVLK